MPLASEHGGGWNRWTRGEAAGGAEEARVGALACVLGAGAGAAAAASGVAALEAATLALAAAALVAAVGSLVVLRAGRGRGERLEAALLELSERGRSPEGPGRADPRVLFLDGEIGTERLRIERRRPRPLDVDQAVAHERALALRTLPAARPLRGSLRVYREPTEEAREAFRDQVDRYAESLRASLLGHEAYRRERALLVAAPLRVENRGQRPARDLVVRLAFPQPFEVAPALPAPPTIPRRPTFHAKRAALSALLGGAPDGVSPERPGPVGLHAAAVDTVRSCPGDRGGSTVVEIEIGSIRPGGRADLARAERWLLRLPRPGVFRIGWEVEATDLDEPARGELVLEVVDHFDDTPIRSVKELLAEESAAGVQPVARLGS